MESGSANLTQDLESWTQYCGSRDCILDPGSLWICDPGSSLLLRIHESFAIALSESSFHEWPLEGGLTGAGGYEGGGGDAA